MAVIDYKDGITDVIRGYDEYKYDGKVIMFIKDGKVFFMVNVDVVNSVDFRGE